MEQKIEYIHNNPVRRGHVNEARHWRYLSTRNYAGTVRLLRSGLRVTQSVQDARGNEENPYV